MLDPLLKQLATPPPQQSQSVPEDVLQTKSKRPRASPTKESEPKNEERPKNPHWSRAGPGASGYPLTFSAKSDIRIRWQVSAGTGGYPRRYPRISAP
ncbi:hypothetical protein PGTUg99_033993 [Puccinia graminis f. sp. tritici]|uniref:Uncharacterized protein n=1 Tax=Puccinia graminis f. sp. tritici TaxID=56615 RepID=A0A5B0NMK2_PUCGR|nr:hypothetical protein PGTUg99_033993 [Puccinia graminis f. sp. tritici]